RSGPDALSDRRRQRRAASGRRRPLPLSVPDELNGPHRRLRRPSGPLLQPLPASAPVERSALLRARHRRRNPGRRSRRPPRIELPATSLPTAVPPERALRVSARPERNPGVPLDLDWVRAVRVNRSAVERRAATIPTRRTVKKEWQAAWLLRAVTCIDLTTLQS